VGLVVVRDLVGVAVVRDLVGVVDLVVLQVGVVSQVGVAVSIKLRDVQLILSQDYQTVTVPNQTDDLARHKQYEPTLCDSNDLSNATYL
jgi:hypothetical protein